MKMDKEAGIINGLKKVAPRVAELGIGALPGAALGAMGTNKANRKIQKKYNYDKRMGRAVPDAPKFTTALHRAVVGGAITGGAAVGLNHVNYKNIAEAEKVVNSRLAEHGDVHKKYVDVLNKIRTHAEGKANEAESNIKAAYKAHNANIARINDEAIRNAHDPDKLRDLAWDKRRSMIAKDSEIYNHSFDYDHAKSGKSRAESVLNDIKDLNYDGTNHAETARGKVFGGFRDRHKIGDIHRRGNKITNPDKTEHSKWNMNNNIERYEKQLKKGETPYVRDTPNEYKEPNYHKEFKAKASKFRSEADANLHKEHDDFFERKWNARGKGDANKEDYKAWKDTTDKGDHYNKYEHSSEKNNWRDNWRNNYNNGSGSSGSSGNTDDLKKKVKEHWDVNLDDLKTKADVKKAYMNAIRKWHPDVNKAPNATEKAQHINDLMDHPHWAKYAAYIDGMEKVANYHEQIYKQAVSLRDIASTAKKVLGDTAIKADVLKNNIEHKADDFVHRAVITPYAKGHEIAGRKLQEMSDRNSPGHNIGSKIIAKSRELKEMPHDDLASNALGVLGQARRAIGVS